MFVSDAAPKAYLRPRARRRHPIRILFLSGLILAGLLAVSTRLVYGDTPSRQGRVVVRAGETVWSIASRNAQADPRPQVDAILRINHLRTPLLRPGQSLIVPAS